MQFRESFRGHDHPAVAELDVDRIIGRGRDQFRLRGPSILRELLGGPAARDNQPGTRRHAVRRLAHTIQSLGKRASADPIDLGGEAERGANGVHVGINQARDYGAALQIDHARVRSGHLAHVGRSAGSDDPVIANRQGLDGGEIGIHGEDFAVEQDRGGGLGVQQARGKEHR